MFMIYNSLKKSTKFIKNVNQEFFKSSNEETRMHVYDIEPEDVQKGFFLLQVIPVKPSDTIVQFNIDLP